jgi:hypothetical protein
MEMNMPDKCLQSFANAHWGVRKSARHRLSALAEGIKMHALAAVACMLPSAALASDPTALYYFMAMQGFSWIWPFVLPLFYPIIA